MAKDIIIIADYTEESLLDLGQVCIICNISSDTINKLIEYEIIHPRVGAPEEWRFTLEDLKRIKTALRLHHDLEINFQSVAIVLQLLAEMDNLRVQLDILEKHFPKL